MQQGAQRHEEVCRGGGRGVCWGPYLVRDGSNVCIGLVWLVAFAWGGVVLGLVVLPLQICQLEGEAKGG